jgi:mono/diheme cytochrome c family protein
MTRIASARTSGTGSAERVEPRNVVDGCKSVQLRKKLKCYESPSSQRRGAPEACPKLTFFCPQSAMLRQGTALDLWSTQFFLGENMKRCCAGVLVTLLVVVSAIRLLCSSTGALAQEPAAKAYSAANVQAGQGVFLSVCFQCHSVNKGEVRVGPSMYGIMKGPHAKSAAEVRLQVTKGKGKMPPFETILTPDQIDQVVAYLHSL